MVRRANTAKLDMMEMMTVMEYAGETAKEEVEAGRFGMSTLGLEDVIDGNAASKHEFFVLTLEPLKISFCTEAHTTTALRIC